MNLPNKLTIARMLLIPVFMVFSFPPFQFGRWAAFVALAVYIIASATDALDGYLARKNNQVTNFGKFLDPIADKLLVTAALLSMIPHNEEGYYLWAAMIILAREFIVSGVRLIAASDGVVIAAGKMGKLKMVAQTVALVILLFAVAMEGTMRTVLFRIGDIFLIAAVILTILSGIEYVVKNAGLLKQDK